MCPKIVKGRFRDGESRIFLPSSAVGAVGPEGKGERRKVCADSAFLNCNTSLEKGDGELET